MRRAKSIEVTPNDIVYSAEKLNGDIFEANFDEVDDNSSKKGKVIYDVTRIPILFKKVTIDADSKVIVKKVPLNKFTFEMVLTASKASLPSQDEKDNHRNMILMFKKFTLGEIRSGDYVSKSKTSPDDIRKEFKRVEELTEELYQNTNEFIAALDAISKGHEILCDKLKKMYVDDQDSFKFNMVKEGLWLKQDEDGNVVSFDPIIRSIKQTSRKGDKGRKIPLDTPLFRLKMPVAGGNKLLLSWRDEQKAEITKPYIFDARKTFIDSSKNTSTLVPAKIKVNGRLKDIDIYNASDFVTYKSIISGNVTFPKITISKQGISINNEFRELVVKRHKYVNTSNTTVSNASLSKMKGDGSDDDVDIKTELEDIDPEPAHKSIAVAVSKSSKTKPAAKPVEVETSEEEAEEVQPKKKSTKKVEAKKPAKKPPTPVATESEDEAEAEEEEEEEEEEESEEDMSLE